jgi:ferrous iron transport protein B
MSTTTVPDSFRVALVGNPNCGKTALFNALTGGRQKVANYPGVTVERKEGNLTTPSGRRVRIVDLPGTYSLRARSPDEAVTRDAVLGRLEGETPPDAIVCVADSTNLRLVLRLALELKQVGRPILLALNMIDIAEHRGIAIDFETLQRELGMPVVASTAVRRGGATRLMEEIDHLVDAKPQQAAVAWHPPSTDEIRTAHLDVERIIKLAVKPPAHPDTWTTRLDSVLLHPVSGILILLAVLFLMFQAVFAWATPAMDAIQAGFDWLGEVINTTLPDGVLRSLISDGIISGVGSVLVFLPQILILFFFIIMLEDFGYMARAAFLMDRVMGGAGLHGRAFIPLLSSFACAIPGIMAARVIESPKDRMTTILIAPLMTCSARIPVYTLIISAFVPNRLVGGFVNLQGLVMFGLYSTGILSALTVAFVLRRLIWKSEIEPFIMELPTYKMPDPKNVIIGLLVRARIFLTRAGTVILGMMILIWFLSSVPGAPEGATDPAIDYSFAGMIGHALAPLLAPIGFNWQIAVALIPGLAAREVAVAALGTIYAVSGGDETSGVLIQTLVNQWTLPTAFSLLAWYVFAPQCAATLGVIKRETNSWRWPIITFIYMITLAYIASFVVYHIAQSLLG